MRQSLKASLLGLVGLVACATSPTLYSENPLMDQVLRPRPGHEGSLTNRTCQKYDGKTCVSATVKEYPLASAEFRETANRLNFVCNIGGKRYKICKDQPGFCRITYEQKCSWGGMICKPGAQIVDYLPVEKYRFLLDANTKCAKREKYNLWAN